MTTGQHVSLGGHGKVGVSQRGLHDAARCAGSVILYIVLPALLVSAVIGGSLGDNFAFDFHQFWQGGRDVVTGHSPYPPAGSVPAGNEGSLDPLGIQHIFRFPYPAPAALAMAPFGLLPFTLAASIFLLCSFAATFLAMRLLGVSDWRCYGVVFASMPTLGALRLGTFTPLLLLGLALAWRYRSRRVAVAGVVGCLIVAKLFLWPLLVWLLVTRRFAAAALALVSAVTITIGSWAVLGFAGLSEYPKLLSALATTVQGRGWSTVALGLSLGLSAATAKTVAFLLGGAALAVISLAPREKRDLWAFSLVVAAAILLSPIVWLHYFLLLVGPLALAYPKLSPAWFIPLGFWVWPFQETGGDIWKIGLGFAALAALCAAVLYAPPRPRPS